MFSFSLHIFLPSGYLSKFEFNPLEFMLAFFFRILSSIVICFLPFQPGFSENKSITSIEETYSSVIIRESTIDIQVRANEHLYVFSKSGGILEKVKIGMDVIYFSQEKLSEVGSAAWKRLKNGDVQIFTSNHGKHQVWTIYGSGRLKMETLVKENSDSSELSFEFAKSQLTRLRWIGEEQTEKVLAYPQVESEVELPIQSNDIDYVVFEFESVELKVTPESKPVGLVMEDSDLASMKFERKVMDQSSNLSEESPNLQSQKIPDFSEKSSLILWFDFN
ncbi:hypothetical protein E4S40_03820 [Algoriphagus kandeliae]|uniref:Uncharacterized protein n=1 Tax=Algoriphagus kandeliae TaxID=2562278 RepID=A0A4Y9QZY2_9BACT|nr:hypothetical protein [Algoriphagus kandeliae]TFV97777.1 hypothetical protein E4S40_03820 [Algoriphagus kandeliae]